MDAKITPVRTPARSKKQPVRRTPVTALASGSLHRAIVSLPLQLCDRDSEITERIVFFECPRFRADEAGHLERLLAAAWCIDTTNWCEDGHIYNITSAHDRITGDTSFSEHPDVELRLFDTGCGGDGPNVVGPDRTHYARADQIDLLVSPRVAVRLQAHMATIEAMYRAEPARRRKAMAAAQPTSEGVAA
jgi:hypothetical protein